MKQSSSGGGASGSLHALFSSSLPTKRLGAVAILIFGLFGVLVFGVAPAGATPLLTVTSTSTSRVSPNSSATLTGLSISGDITDTLQATVATDLGTLSISTTTGLTLGYNNTWSGTSITFTGSQSDINAALATTSLTTSATTGTAHVGLTAMVAQSGYFYLAANQHFYEYVSSSGTSWTVADAAAKLLTFQGQPGYLATIPNASVNTFISSKIANATNVWLGARAYENIATDGTQAYATVNGTTYPRVWRWTVGSDESPIAGTVVSECSNISGGCTFQNSGSFYSSWATGEPNNANGSSSTAYQGEYVPVTNWNGSSGSWNDLRPTDGSQVNGYVVEFGGKTNADSSLGTGFSGVVTATSNVLVAAAATVPSAPTITGTRGDSSASLSWTPASDGGAPITAYQVSTDGGNNWNTISTSSSTATVNGNLVTTISATAAPLTNGTSYNIQIRALNSAGNGGASNTVAITPAGVPAAPTAVSAARGNASATVSFGAASNNGAAITGYTVTSSPGGVTATCASSPCVITGLTNGTAYTFTVHATNSVGNSAESSASSAVTPATVPGAPTGVSAVRASSSAAVSFTAPASSGGSAVTSYTVTSSPGGVTATCASSPCVITGLTNGTGYTFTVHATNSVGNGAESSASSAITPATVPDAPTSVSATRGNGSASVSFSAPGSNGGSAITDYTVTSAPGGVTHSCSFSPCVITGLTNGTAYTFTVHATNAIGDGPESSASGAVTPMTVPGAPTAVGGTRGDGQVSLDWTNPTSDGGSAITSYTVTASPGGASAACAASPCVVTGLVNGTGYQFTVHGTNSVGDGANSSASPLVIPAGLPAAPASFTAQRSDQSVLLTFDPPGSNGSAITGYQVSTDGGLNWQPLTTSGTSHLSATVTGLINGTSYDVEVRAVNGVGAGTPTGPTTETPATVPDAPTAVAATRGNGQVSVTWSAPTNNGGDAVTGYSVTSSPGGITQTCSASPCVVTGLTNGTAYTFTAHATNSVGPGAESVASGAVTPATVPDAPTTASAVRGNGSATVTFAAPTANGGSAISSYTVTSAPGGVTATCSSSPCVVTGLTNGTAYTFTVHASNLVGNSVESTATGAVTPVTVPDAPTTVLAVRGDGSASVSFTAPAGNGGSAITGYTVTASPGGATAVCTAGPCVIPGLVNGTAYTFTVHATNSVGDSAESVASAAVTPAAVPNAPSAVSAVRGDASAVVSFGAPSSNGAPITSYTVTTSPGGVVATCSTSPCTVTGLVNGTAYTFTVHATNSVGAGPESSPSAAVTPAAVPDAPGSLAVQRGDGSITVSFDTPASHGSAITGYQVSINGGVTWQMLITTGSPGLHGTVVGLTNGATYAVEVRALNGVDAGLPAGPASVTPAGVPDAVTGVGATGGNGSATVSFTAPAGNGSAIVGYRITVSPGGRVVSCDASPCVVSGLTNGTAYSFSVAATNGVGDGALSNPSAAVSPAGPPAAAQAPTVDYGDGQATISWTAPTSLNGATITGYTVTASPGGASCTVPAGATSCVVPGLANGVEYAFMVVVHSTAGDSPLSAAAGPTGQQKALISELAFTGDAVLPKIFGALALMLAGAALTVLTDERRSGPRRRQLETSDRLAR